MLKKSMPWRQRERDRCSHQSRTWANPVPDTITHSCMLVLFNWHSFLRLLRFCQKEPSESMFFMCQMLFLLPTISVRSPNRTHSTDVNQEKSSSGLIHSWSINSWKKRRCTLYAFNLLSRREDTAQNYIQSNQVNKCTKHGTTGQFRYQDDNNDDDVQRKNCEPHRFFSSVGFIDVMFYTFQLHSFTPYSSCYLLIGKHTDKVYAQ